jgi:hypothetical protein
MIRHYLAVQTEISFIPLSNIFELDFIAELYIEKKVTKFWKNE